VIARAFHYKTELRTNETMIKIAKITKANCEQLRRVLLFFGASFLVWGLFWLIILLLTNADLLTSYFTPNEI
jgi:hypothetical protein